jgi:glycosyltransferase involved in cell wall biosynthesis
LKERTRPRLLILTSSFPRGPQDEVCGYVRSFAESLSGEFDVQVLAPPDSGSQPASGAGYRLTRSRSILPARLDPFTACDDLNDLSTASLLVKMLAAVSLASFVARAFTLALKADIICSHWLVPSGLVGSIISKALGKPHICIEHSGALHLLARLRAGRMIARLVAAGSQQIVTVSNDLKRRSLALFTQVVPDIAVIPMGVHMREASGGRFENAGARAHEILFIGRLTGIKGLDLLIRAMTQVAHARLKVAGEGPERASLERLAKELRVDAKFLGHVPAGVREHLLSSCDVVVIPSRVLSGGRTEGMPVVCLEAMAAGRPVIASRVGGLAEIIEDGSNGLLFDPGDEQMLADRLNLALGDVRLRQRLAGNAFRTAARYDWPVVAAEYGRIIKSCLRSDGKLKHDQASGAGDAASGYN